jgi:hypothetical protein
MNAGVRTDLSIVSIQYSLADTLGEGKLGDILACAAKILVPVATTVGRAYPVSDDRGRLQCY